MYLVVSGRGLSSAQIETAKIRIFLEKKSKHITIKLSFNFAKQRNKKI
jgi:hypothetical protein